MKKIRSLLFLLCFVIVLFQCSSIVKAAELYSNDSIEFEIMGVCEDELLEFNSNIVKDYNNHSVTLGKTVILPKNLKQADCTEEINQAEDTEILEDEVVQGTLSTGTISGFLKESGDYVLYPTQLSAGDYLQTRLTVPSDINIDYDLLLYDANFNLIKVSDYITAINPNGPLPEALGYIADNDVTVYITVYSSLGGSDSVPYVLDYAISAPNIDDEESDENVHECKSIDLGKKGLTISRIINSALDCDWYKFTVLDNVDYSKIRFQLSSNSSKNGCKFEVYNNLVSNTNFFAMNNVLHGTGGEAILQPGDYYLRIISANELETFDASEIPAYTLSITPVGIADSIGITRLADHNGNSIFIEYNEGELFREERDSFGLTYVNVYGRAKNGMSGAPNVKINGSVTNVDMKDAGMFDAISYASTYTDEQGYFYMGIHLAQGIGHRGAIPRGGYNYHKYDLMELSVELDDNKNVKVTIPFYLYCYTDN